MAGSYNRVILVGNLTRDPEIRYTQSGKGVTKFTLAVNNKSAQMGEETTFVDIVAWDRLGETCNTYLKKGSNCLVEGRLVIRSYDDKDGNKRKGTGGRHRATCRSSLRRATAAGATRPPASSSTAAAAGRLERRAPVMLSAARSSKTKSRSRRSGARSAPRHPTATESSVWWQASAFRASASVETRGPRRGTRLG